MLMYGSMLGWINVIEFGGFLLVVQKVGTKEV